MENIPFVDLLATISHGDCILVVGILADTLDFLVTCIINRLFYWLVLSKNPSTINHS